MHDNPSHDPPEIVKGHEGKVWHKLNKPSSKGKYEDETKDEPVSSPSSGCTFLMDIETRSTRKNRRNLGLYFLWGTDQKIRWLLEKYAEKPPRKYSEVLWRTNKWRIFLIYITEVEKITIYFYIPGRLIFLNAECKWRVNQTVDCRVWWCNTNRR